MEVDEWKVDSTSHCEIKLVHHVVTFSRKEQAAPNEMTSSVYFDQPIREVIKIKDQSEIHGTNNGRYRQSGISATFRIELLQKVIHCLKYMHENVGGFVPIDSSCVYLSKDKKQIAIAEPAAGNNIINMEGFARFALLVLSNGLVSDNDDTFPGNPSLSDLYQERVNASLLLRFLIGKQHEILFPELIKSLTGFLSCKEPILAFDLVMYIKKHIGKHKYNKILSHPFFWSESKKCQFICAVFGYFKMEDGFGDGYREKYDKTLSDKYNMSGGFVFSGSGWIESLKISEDELSKLNQKVNLVTSTEIYEQSNNFKEHSLYDLMRFFRNRYTHLLEDAEAVRQAFENSSTGFWNFFASRYPCFLYYVYVKMWRHVKKHEEIRSIRECAPDSTYLRTVYSADP